MDSTTVTSVHSTASKRLKCPLVVDLDGTLTPTDTLAESVIQLIKVAPLLLRHMPLWLLKGRAAFKQTVASHTNIAAAMLPYNESLLTYLLAEKKNGRKIILATAAHKSIADRVASHLGLFDLVLATDASNNLKGTAKLEAIRQHVGQEFVYAGDNQADLPIWNAAQAVVLVGVSTRVAQSIRRDIPIEQEFPKEAAGISIWLRALRVHQWLKNILLFVPLLTAFSFMNVEKLISIAVAFLAFSVAASATYLLNDLWDLENDRAHPRKRLRPFASGKIPISHGLAVAASALTAACILALYVSTTFFLMLSLYLGLTSAYSWALKKHALVDVVMLSLLYTLRILAGSVAIGVVTTSWLLAFSVFIFLSLALVKRCSELVSVERDGGTAIRGRDYRVTDLVVLWPLGVGAALSAVVIFGLFISAPETRMRYATPDLLWLVAIGLIYWLARIWLKTARGEMHDDPLIYAMKDHGSRIIVLAMIIITLAAHFLSLNAIP